MSVSETLGNVWINNTEHRQLSSTSELTATKIGTEITEDAILNILEAEDKNKQEIRIRKNVLPIVLI